MLIIKRFRISFANHGSVKRAITCTFIWCWFFAPLGFSQQFSSVDLTIPYSEDDPKVQYSTEASDGLAKLRTLARHYVSISEVGAMGFISGSEDRPIVTKLIVPRKDRVLVMPDFEIEWSLTANAKLYYEGIESLVHLMADFNHLIVSAKDNQIEILGRSHRGSRRVLIRVDDHVHWQAIEKLLVQMTDWRPKTLQEVYHRVSLQPLHLMLDYDLIGSKRWMIFTTVYRARFDQEKTGRPGARIFFVHYHPNPAVGSSILDKFVTSFNLVDNSEAGFIAATSPSDGDLIFFDSDDVNLAEIRRLGTPNRPGNSEDGTVYRYHARRLTQMLKSAREILAEIVGYPPPKRFGELIDKLEAILYETKGRNVWPYVLLLAAWTKTPGKEKILTLPQPLKLFLYSLIKPKDTAYFPSYLRSRALETIFSMYDLDLSHSYLAAIMVNDFFVLLPHESEHISKAMQRLTEAVATYWSETPFRLAFEAELNSRGASVVWLFHQWLRTHARKRHLPHLSSPFPNSENTMALLQTVGDFKRAFQVDSEIPDLPAVRDIRISNIVDPGGLKAALKYFQIREKHLGRLESRGR